jgi:hypothetical protein
VTSHCAATVVRGVGGPVMGADMAGQGRAGKQLWYPFRWLRFPRATGVAPGPDEDAGHLAGPSHDLDAY